MWVAQLKQPIIIRSPSLAPNGTRLGTFASARVACRYFVQTAALFTIGLEHAAAYWKGLHGALGERLKLTDEASAFARADASEGIHYSFEKPDQVSCSTVHERLLTFDVATYRGELVSFSIAEASVEAAREHIVSTLNCLRWLRKRTPRRTCCRHAQRRWKWPQHRHRQKMQQR